MKLSVKNITLIGLFTAITAIFAQISIPIGEVPITLQVFAVLLSIYILDKKTALFVQITYLLLGAIGIPVFANFKGGLNILVGPTGGYLLSFPIVVLIVGLLIEKSRCEKIWFLIFSGIIGVLVCYTIGTIQLSYITNMGINKAIAVGALPFIGFDIGKVILAAVIGKNTREKLIRLNLIKNI